MLGYNPWCASSQRCSKGPSGILSEPYTYDKELATGIKELACINIGNIFILSNQNEY